MNLPAIQVENLSKLYHIGHHQQHYDTLRDALAGSLRSIKHYSMHRTKNKQDQIWALHDVTFDVFPGEILGVIGSNGAGKSTLLKLLSRITEPTTGKAVINGRVGSLLEVGTGFHPELTGRENIYLNGAILGMTHKEIDCKFDEIVTFSEIEKFIDTPVKRYSSGMYVRLAFAVAAHLEPEVLLIDEVLAVGDINFQKKCLGKMGDISSQGRTILFVSHNLGGIRTLCTKGLLLKEGRILFMGSAEEAIDRYQNIYTNNTVTSIAYFPKPSGHPIWIESVKVLFNNVQKPSMTMGENMMLEIKFTAEKMVQNPSIGLIISSFHGENIIDTNNIYQNSKPSPKPIRTGIIRCDIGMIPLLAGNYYISVWLGDENHTRHHQIKKALSFEVIGKDIWGKGTFPTERNSTLWWPTNFECIEDPENKKL